MKNSLMSLVLALVSIPALTGEAATPVIERLQVCSELQGSRQRLACFDREFAPFKTRKTAPVTAAAAPAAAPASPGPTPNTTSGSFGEEQLSAKLKPSVAEEDLMLHARIAALREVEPGTYLVTLDNGQVWRHENQMLGSYLREGEAVTIRKAPLGSYRLTRDEGAEKNWIRMTRVR